MFLSTLLAFFSLNGLNVGGQAHVVLKMFEIVTDQLGDDLVLFCRLQLQFHHLRPRRVELLFQGLDMTKLLSLHDHRIVRAVHHIIRLEVKSVGNQQRIYSLILL